MTDKKPTFELAVDTRLIYQRLRDLQVGETIPYETLDELIGRSVRNGAYSNLSSARRRCLMHDGIVLGTVQKVGLKRLNDEEIVATADNEIDGIRRKARRAARKVACTDYSKLPVQSQVKHNTGLSLFSAVTGMTKTKKVQQFEDHVAKAQAELPLAKTLEFFTR